MNLGQSTPTLPNDEAVALAFVTYGILDDVVIKDLLLTTVGIFKDMKLSAVVSAHTQTEAALNSTVLAHPDAQIVVLYDRAEYAVLAALDAGTLPLDALESWEESAHVLLAHYRKYRRKILLVDRGECCENPERFITGLAQHLKLAPIKDIALTPLPTPAHGVHRIIAVQSVLQSPRAIQLNGELAAGSLPITSTGKSLSCDVNQVFGAYQKKSNNILAMQDKLAHAQQHDSAAAQEKAEKDVAILQLSHSQEALEASWHEGRTVKTERDTLQHQLNNLSGQLETHKKAAQELAPLQAKLSLVEKKSHKHDISAQELQREKELLQMQLEAVQQEMERYYMEATSLKRKQDEVEKTLGDLAGQVSTATVQGAAVQKQLEQTQADLAEKNQALETALHHGDHLQEQVHLREEDLRRVLDSNAWKVTGPLRRAKDGLTNRGKQEE